MILFDCLGAPRLYCSGKYDGAHRASHRQPAKGKLIKIRSAACMHFGKGLLGRSHLDQIHWRNTLSMLYSGPWQIQAPRACSPLLVKEAVAWRRLRLPWLRPL